MRSAIAVLAGLLLSGSAVAQTTPNWALHYVPPPAEWNALWASKQDYNAPGKFTTLTATGTATVTGSATISGTLGVTGNTTIGSNTAGNTFLFFNGASTSQKGIRFQTAGVERWRISTLNNETGINNSGQDLSLQKFTDAGAGSVLATIFRSNGQLIYNSFGLFKYPTSLDNDPNPALFSWTQQKGGRGGVIGFSSQATDESYVYTAVPNWITATSYTTGTAALVGGYNIIVATSSGTSGGITPTCSNTVPTCSDGGVSWAFETKRGVSYQLVGGTSRANFSVSMGGTPTGAQGRAYGHNPICTMVVANTLGCIGSEIDVGMSFPGLQRIGQQIVATLASQGTIDDVAWRFGLTGGTPGFRHVMDWGARTGQIALDPNGYGLRVWSETDGNPTTPSPTNMLGAGALDLTEFQPSGSGEFGGGFILRGPGSQILGSGDIQSNFALLHQTATGASLDASQYHVTAVAVHAGGGGTKWLSGFLADCTDGSVVRVTSVSGGAVTGVSLWIGAYGNAPIATVTCTSEQQVGPLDDAGNALLPDTIQVDETWALANTGAPVLALGGVATVTASTAAPGTNTTQLATTAFSAAAIAVETSRATTAESLLAPKASPTFTGTVNAAAATFAGTVNVGNNATAQILNINGPAGGGRVLVWETAGARRWQWNVNATAESGANAGSDLVLQAWDDAGTSNIFTPLSITRSTGTIAFGTLVRFNGSSVVANGAIATTMTSLGPTGSHTTIQEWLSVQNASGTTRYIPLY